MTQALERENIRQINKVLRKGNGRNITECELNDYTEYEDGYQCPKKMKFEDVNNYAGNKDDKKGSRHGEINKTKCDDLIKQGINEKRRKDDFTEETENTNGDSRHLKKIKTHDISGDKNECVHNSDNRRMCKIKCGNLVKKGCDVSKLESSKETKVDCGSLDTKMTKTNGLAEDKNDHHNQYGTRHEIADKQRQPNINQCEKHRNVSNL